MNPHNKDEFHRAWEVLDDPKAIREIMERDQEAEDEKAVSNDTFRVEGGQKVRQSVGFADTQNKEAS